MNSLLVFFVVLTGVQFIIETALSLINRRHYMDLGRQQLAQKTLQISDTDWKKTVDYTSAKYFFGLTSQAVSTLATLIFICVGGFGIVELTIKQYVAPDQKILTGLLFIVCLSVLSSVISLPFELYRIFKIEEKFGFNRQTLKIFFVDKIKGIFLGALLGGPLLALILWIMQTYEQSWWYLAWGVITVFSLVTAWIFPTFLAPLFNKFSPLTDGELKTQIEELAAKIGFKSAGISIMDASKRSSHGNAYFTGVFGAKKIVLFDTLVKALTPTEVVAVLAHELGHFKLNHVRQGLIRSIILTGVMFFIFSQLIHLEAFYQAFYLDGISQYGALVVFSMWFGLVSFYVQPVFTLISRKHEFEADDFAKTQLGTGLNLKNGLLKLREESFTMPIRHPITSAFYDSHPPILERMKLL